MPSKGEPKSTSRRQLTSGMQSVIGWTVGVGLLWFVCSVGVSVLASASGVSEKFPGLVAVSRHVMEIGGALGTFIAPVLQLTLILFILVAVAERFGFTTEKRDWSKFVSTTSNVQALIAVVIVCALVVGALAGIARVDVLKDIALVVVGFYFGTRGSQASNGEALQSGTVAALPAAPAPGVVHQPPDGA